MTPFLRQKMTEEKDDLLSPNVRLLFFFCSSEFRAVCDTLLHSLLLQKNSVASFLQQLLN